MPLELLIQIMQNSDQSYNCITYIAYDNTCLHKYFMCNILYIAMYVHIATLIYCNTAARGLTDIYPQY